MTWAVILLFLATRLAVLWFIDPAQMFRYGGEELYQGTIGKLILDHVGYPLLSYRPSDYLGGPLVVGVMASFFFRLFGANALAFKLVPLTFFSAGLGAWHATLRRFFNARVALIFSLLYIFSPPNFTTYSVSAIGFHSETIAFTGISLWLLLSLLEDRNRSWLYAACLGLTAGFASWFSFHYLLTLAAVLIYWVWHRGGKAMKAEAAAFSVCFLIGFSPWLYSNLGDDSIQGWRIHDTPFWQWFDPTRWSNEFEIWLLATPFGGENWPIRIKTAADGAYCLAFAAILLPGLARLRRLEWRRPRPSYLMGLYLIIFLLVTQACALKEWRYFIPGFPFLFFFVASAIASFNKRTAAIALGGLVCLSAAFHGFMLSPSHAGEILATKGYAYGVVPEVLCLDASSCVGYYHALLPKTTPEEGFQAAESVAAAVVSDLFSAHPYPVALARLQALAQAESPPLRGELYYAAGEWVSSDRKRGVRRAKETLKGEELRLFVWGATNDGADPFDRTGSDYRELLAQARRSPRDTAPELWRAAGKRFARRRHAVDPGLVNLISGVALEFKSNSWTPERRRWFAQGLGAYLVSAWNDGAAEPRFESVFLQGFPRDLQSSVFFGAGLQSVLDRSIEDPGLEARRRAEFSRGVSAENLAAFDEGRKSVFSSFGAGIASALALR